jgi:hypothetical protein
MDTSGPTGPGFLLYGERTDTGTYSFTFLWPCRVYGCRSSPMWVCLKVGGWKGGLSDVGLLASSVGPFDGWLGRLTSSYWVLLSGKPNSKGDRLWWFEAFVALICLWSLKLSLCDGFERCLKEVDCLPMVRPDAGSHLGIRHVHMCLSGVIDCW